MSFSWLLFDSYSDSKSASASSLTLEGFESAAIDGRSLSGLLRISGSGAVTVNNVAFRSGAVSYLGTLGDYAPVTVGFPNPMKQPTNFNNCSFTDSIGAYGGAVALHHGLTVFDSCTFVNCSSYGNGGPDVPHQHGGGGAVYNIGGHVTLRRSRFINNTCSDPPGSKPGSTGGHNGGAVLAMQGSVEVYDCDFIGGKAGQAGALYLFLYASLVATNSRFINNQALSIANHSWASGTGGAIFMDRGPALIDNSSFEGNSAALAGGALYAWNSHGDHSGKLLNVTITGSKFARNSAQTQWGGAVANWHSTVLADDCSFDANTAAVMAGALWTDAESTSNLTRCAWTVNNSAPQGSAVWSHPKGKTDLADHNVFIVDTQQEALKKPAFFAQCKIEDDGLDVHVQNQNPQK